MTNQDIAKVLEEIGDLLELSDDNPYRGRAYRNGAQVLRENPGYPLDDSAGVSALPGIGASLASVIVELHTTGRSVLHQTLQEKVPPEFRKLLHVPGLGSKTLRLVLQQIKPRTIAEVEQAIANREIRKIKGLSSKTEAKLKQGLEMIRQGQDEFALGIALPLGRALIDYLRKTPAVDNAAIVGSTSRGRETVRDIDIVISSIDEDAVVQAVTDYPKVERVVTREDNRLSVLTWVGLKIDCFIVPPEVYEQTVEHLRGDVAHHARLRELGAAKGQKWEQLMPRDVYPQLGLPVLPPELREAESELSLPENLLELGDIRGDLHMHTRWSDGAESVKTMALAAAARGYEYIAICDHTKNLAIAKGLKEEQLLKQRQEIINVNEELQGKIKVLAGAEVDILKDGRLDYPDEVLRDLDVVVASVHVRYKQNIEEMTERIEQALKNPYVDILAHPTGRLIGRRDPYGVHLERVFETAARNRKAVEINASPSRLDLKDKHVLMAQEFGLPIVIDTDAHSVEELADMEYGVMTARRAALDRERVLNAQPLAELQKWLGRK